MVSKTTRTQTIRQRKARTRGRARKNALENHGTSLPREELFKVRKKEEG